MKFLGTLIHDIGEVAPAWPEILPLLHRIFTALSGVGLALYLAALLQAIHVKALPTCLYDCEFWVLRDLAGVMLHGSSPFCSPHFLQLLGFLKWYSGLPVNVFNALVYRLYQLHTFPKLVLPHVLALSDSLSPIQWVYLCAVAVGLPLGGVHRLADIA